MDRTGRDRSHRLRLVHRLPLLHGRVPVRGAPLQLDRAEAHRRTAQPEHARARQPAAAEGRRREAARRRAEEPRVLALSERNHRRFPRAGDAVVREQAERLGSAC